MNLQFVLRGHASLVRRNGMPMSAGSIGYEVRGPNRGIPLLLIRPLGGSMALWGTFRTLLEERFRVIAFDLRGMGRSSRTSEWATTRRLAGDALRVLDELEHASGVRDVPVEVAVDLRHGGSEQLDPGRQTAELVLVDDDDAVPS